MNNFFKILLAFVFSVNAYGQDWVEKMMDPSVNFYDVQKAFNDEWEGKEYERGKGYKQYKRWEWFMEQRVGETGVRPDPAILYNTILAAKSSASSSPAPLGTWTAIGPMDGPSNFGIGRINAVEFDPSDSDIIWAGAPSGGLWKSTDGGQTWTTNTDELTNIGVSDIVIDPTDTDVMYIATGDRDGGDTYSFGILKSIDGGQTWNTTGLSWNVVQSKRIGKIVLHPNDSQIIIAAVSDGIYKSIDGGISWNKKANGGFKTVIANLNSPDTLLAGTANVQSGGARIYRSTDGGDNWSVITTGLPTFSSVKRVEIAGSLQDPNYYYALFSGLGHEYAGLYQSTDAGVTWSLKSSSPNILGSSPSGNGSGGQSWYDLCISVSPSNKNQVFIGGVNLWRSNNQGSTWSCIGGYTWGGNSIWVHPDMHYMKFKPGSDSLYVGHDGGISVTSNAGSSWLHLIDGMNITQYYKMSNSQTSADLIICGAQDNSTHLFDGSSWDVVNGGDGMDCEIDPVNNNIMFASSQYGNFRRSTNGGQSFQYISGIPQGTGGWVTPIEIDPSNHLNVYIGYNRLYKSTNSGASGSWTAVSGNLSGQIVDIAIAPSNGNIIYIAINSSIYRSVNGGSNFSNISQGLSGTDGITDIAISETNANHLWLCKSGYGSNKVFESTNGGSTWTNITDNLPNLPCNAIEYENGSSDGIYVGTDVGVYYRDNNTQGWVSFMEGLPNVIVNDLEVFYGGSKLRAATYGRGIWESDLYSTLVGVPEAQFYASPQATCSVNDTVRLVDQSTFSPTGYKWTIYPSGAQFVNGTSDTSQSPYVVFNSEKEYTITLKASNVYGTDTETKYNYIAAGGYAIPFTETWEDSLAIERWAYLNPDNSNTWNIENVSGNTPGNRAIKMEHFNYSSIGAEDELWSPSINLKNLSNATLTFDYAYRRYNASRSDSLHVYISTDCGSTWSLLANYGENGTGNFATGSVNQTSSFTPSSSSDWCGGSNASCKVISLDSYVGNSGVRIKFVSTNGNGNNLYIDNINITGASSISPVAYFLSDTSACEGSSISFTDLSNGQPSSWLWSFPGANPSSSTLSNPVVTYSNPGTYSVKLKVSNGVGSDSLEKVSFIVIDTLQSPSISVSAVNNTICHGDTAWFLATAFKPGDFPTYSWKVNGNSAGANSPVFSIPNYTNGDSVWCELASSHYCVSNPNVVSSKVAVTVNSLPNVSLPGFGNFCITDSAITLTGGTPPGGVYTGSGVNNGVFDPALAGQGSHWISYTYTDNNGCSNTAKVTSYIYNTPNKPTISLVYPNILKCNQNMSTYQWVDGSGNDIPGATSQTYVAPANGYYSVKVQDGFGCPNASDLIALENISIDENTFGNNLRIFPNPTKDVFSVEFESSKTSSLMVTISNITGDQIMLVEQEVKSGFNSFEFDLSPYADGVYFISLEKDSQRVVEKVTKY